MKIIITILLLNGLVIINGRDMFTALVELTKALKAENSVAKELRSYINQERLRIQKLERLDFRFTFSKKLIFDVGQVHVQMPFKLCY